MLLWTGAVRAPEIVTEIVTRGFRLWTLAAAGAGLRYPTALAQLRSPQSFRKMLALLMLAMGLTITPQQLSGVLRNAPRAIAVKPRVLLRRRTCRSARRERVDAS
jgi:predicted Na+-dependent transporter